MSKKIGVTSLLGEYKDRRSEELQNFIPGAASRLFNKISNPLTFQSKSQEGRRSLIEY